MLGLRNQLLTGLLCLVFSVSAQSLHKVKMGETLYSVSKQHGITIAELIKANNEADHGLKAGMELVIPQKGAKQDTVETFDYKLKVFESFYSIKKKFGIDRDELLKYNPELIEGFRSGRIIQIPKKELVIIEGYAKNSAIEKHVEELKEKERPKNIELKDQYQLSYLLPLYLDLNDSLEFQGSESESPAIYKKSQYALEFYQGAIIALDSLKSMGLNAEVFIYDTENSKKKTSQIAKENDVEASDLIIGPFYTDNFKLASNILKSKRVPMVVPLSKEPNLTKDLKYVYQVQPSVYRMLQLQSQYIQDQYGSFPITVIRRDTMEEEDLSNFMTAHIDKEINTYYKEEILQTELIDSVTDLMMDSTIENHIIIIPSNDRVFVSDILTKLNKTRLKNITVFTTPKVAKFRNIDQQYLSNLNVHYPDLGKVDYQAEITQLFLESYRKKYQTEPSSSFAFTGFDVTFYFGRILLEYGKIDGKYYMEPAKMTKTSFDFNAKKKSSNGHVNYAVTILKYQGQDLIPVMTKDAKED